MKIFVFDTETTGFINKKETDLTKQPYVVQFAGIMGDIKNGKFITEKEINILIKPPIAIPYGASQVHHIYDVDVKNAPTIDAKMDEMLAYINEADVIVWHNIEYDEGMILLELKRTRSEYKYKPKQVICTMKTTVDYCALQGKWERFKFPKLGELHKKLFGGYFLWAHDAMVDVEATAKCLAKLVQENVIQIEKPKQEVMSLF